MNIKYSNFRMWNQSVCFQILKYVRNEIFKSQNLSLNNPFQQCNAIVKPRLNFHSE